MPAYYQLHGGFIFCAAVNLYMYLIINRPPIDDLIRLKYRRSEEVERVEDIQHELARGALARTGIDKMIEISSLADVPDGTGLGSSGSYLVGLLHALRVLKGEKITPEQLAEEAFEIVNKDLGLPDGKQDFYAASLGNFSILDIAQDGRVTARTANITQSTRQEFEQKTLIETLY